MYIDCACEQSDMVDKEYLIITDMPVRCCSCIIKEGSIIKVRMNTSKRIVLIKAPNGGLHKVKMSTLRRCSTEKIQEIKNVK